MPRSSRPGVFLIKDVLRICSKFAEHLCRSVISIKLQSNSIEITLWHGCSSVMHILRKPFFKNTSGWLLLNAQMLVMRIFLNDIVIESSRGMRAVFCFSRKNNFICLFIWMRIKLLFPLKSPFTNFF